MTDKSVAREFAERIVFSPHPTAISFVEEHLLEFLKLYVWPAERDKEQAESNFRVQLDLKSDALDKLRAVRQGLETCEQTRNALASALKEVDETLDECDRANGDAPHRAVGRCGRIRALSQFLLDAKKELEKEQHRTQAVKSEAFQNFIVEPREKQRIWTEGYEAARKDLERQAMMSDAVTLPILKGAKKPLSERLIESGTFSEYILSLDTIENEIFRTTDRSELQMFRARLLIQEGP